MSKNVRNLKTFVNSFSVPSLKFTKYNKINNIKK